MKIHHLRNATCIIESDDHHILIDPMLGSKYSLPPFSYFRFKRLKNPLVELPANAVDALNKVSACLITHSQKFGIKAFQHTDHLDKSGEAFLRDKGIAVATIARDARILRKYGLNLRAELHFWKPQQFSGAQITAIPARHGHGWLHHFMANGAGYFIGLPNEPSLYISGDTVYTTEVERVLTELRPDISILASGTATMDVSKPILMPLEEILEFIGKAPGKVIVNHLEALNHCPTTRAQIRQAVQQHGLAHKTIIPNDGEIIVLSKP